MTSKDVFSKNGDACRHGPGSGYRASANRCIHYYLLSKVCVVVDKVPISSRPTPAGKVPGADDKSDTKNSTSDGAQGKESTSNPATPEKQS